VIPALIRKCLGAQQSGAPEVDVWGTGAATREFLYVDDAARGILLAAERYDKAEPVNLGTSEEVSIRDLVTAIARLTGFEGRVVWNHSRPDGQPRRKLDVSRAQHEFGFAADVRLEAGLRTTIDWYRESTGAAVASGTGL
jgi:GDP-L-fucose synthase